MFEKCHQIKTKRGWKILSVEFSCLLFLTDIIWVNLEIDRHSGVRCGMLEMNSSKFIKLKCDYQKLLGHWAKGCQQNIKARPTLRTLCVL